jgi:hypothetical protein
LDCHPHRNEEHTQHHPGGSSVRCPDINSVTTFKKSRRSAFVSCSFMVLSEPMGIRPALRYPLRRHASGTGFSPSPPELKRLFVAPITP